MSDMNCPYCDADIEVCTDDGYGCDESITYQEECHNCGKLFVFTTGFSQDFYQEKSDCLNGAEHEWREYIARLKRHTSMTCKICNEKRCLTEKEELKYYGEAEDGKS